MSDQTLKNLKRNIHLWCLHKKWVGRGVLKNYHMCADFIILNIRSIVHFCGWWRWEGHVLVIFCGRHIWVTSKTIIIEKNKCLESKRVRYYQNFKFNYKTNSNLIISPMTQILRTTASSGIYFMKANNGNARTMYGICSKFTTIKKAERGQ